MKNCKEVLDFLKDTSIPLNNRIDAISILYMNKEIAVTSAYNSWYWRNKGNPEGLLAFYFDDDNRFRVLCTYNETALALNDYEVKNIARTLNNLRDNEGKELNKDQVKMVNKFFGQEIFVLKDDARYYPIIIDEDVYTYNEKENEYELVLNLTNLNGDWEL